MMKSATTDLTAHLRAGSIDDHDKILAAAIAASKKNPADMISRQSRVVALLKLDRFADALAVLAEGGDALEHHCVLEKAYALYKTGHLEEATAWLLSAGAQTTEPRLAHVSAQIAYRAERYADALNIYRRLIPQVDSNPERNDLNINLEATIAQLLWKGEGYQARRDVSLATQTGSFESCYNMACHCAARGDLHMALTLVERALRLCGDAENLSDEDRRAESRPIELQESYLLSRLGRPEQAANLLSSLDNTQAEPSATDEPAILARNNLSGMKAIGKNRFGLQGFIPNSIVSKASSNLSSFQRELLGRNLMVADLMAQKCKGVRSRTRRKLNAVDHPALSVDSRHAGVLNIVAASGQGVLHGSDGIRLATKARQKRPDDVGVLLTTVQLYAESENYDGAIQVLQAYLRNQERSKTERGLSARFCPGLVALAVGLYRQGGRQTSLRSELVKAIAHWTKHGLAAPQLLEKAGLELLNPAATSHLDVAGAAFEYLCHGSSGGSSGGSASAEAGLVASFATKDFHKTQPYLDRLPPVSELVPQSIDIKQLLRAGVAPVPVAGRPEPPARRTFEEPTAQYSRKRRRRAQPKLSSDHNQAAPDPERWLPMRDRSSYRPRGKKGKKKAGESTQGGLVVNEEETIELVGGAGAVKVEKAPVSGPSKKKKRAKK